MNHAEFLVVWILMSSCIGSLALLIINHVDLWRKIDEESKLCPKCRKERDEAAEKKV